MTALGYMTTKETIVGWRCWRVLPYDLLAGGWTYRLCAVGTLGVPKVWNPMRPTEAVCSKYESEHASPWPDCECGVWGLDRLETARRRMIAFMQTQSEPSAWAWGQVSLWGRVIEHEKGWRGPYAYPYALKIESEEESVARVIRDQYAVDVEWVGGELYAKALAKRKAEAERKQEELLRIKRDLKKVETELRSVVRTTPRDEIRAAREKELEDKRRVANEALLSMPCVSSLDDLTHEELLAAYITAIAARAERSSQAGRSITLHPWGLEEVTEIALVRRGEKPPFLRHKVARAGFPEAHRAMRRALRKGRLAGLFEYGLPFDDRHHRSHGGYWFVTRTGLQMLAHSGVEAWTYYESQWLYEEQRSDYVAHEIDLAKWVRKLRRLRRPAFVEEVEALMPQWMAERRAAAKRGKRAYAEWLAERRENGRPEMLWFADEEVLAAFGRVEQPARTMTVMDVLAPAPTPGDRFRGEVGHFSQQLVRLAKEGRLARSDDDQNKPVWEVVSNA